MNGHGAIVDAHRSRTELSHCTVPRGGKIPNAPPRRPCRVRQSQVSAHSRHHTGRTRRDRDGHRTQNSHLTNLTPLRNHSSGGFVTPTHQCPVMHKTVTNDAYMRQPDACDAVHRGTRPQLPTQDPQKSSPCIENVPAKAPKASSGVKSTPAP